MLRKNHWNTHINPQGKHFNSHISRRSIGRGNSSMFRLDTRALVTILPSNRKITQQRWQKSDNVILPKMINLIFYSLRNDGVSGSKEVVPK